MTENQILTLGEGDLIKLEDENAGSGDSPINLDNLLQPLLGTCKVLYKLKDSDEDPIYAEDLSGIDDMYWSIKSRLDIDVSSGDYQRLYSNQVIDLFDKNNDTVTPTTQMISSSNTAEIHCFNLNIASHLLGNDTIDVSVVSKRKDGTNYPPTYPMNAYYYKLSIVDGDIAMPIRNELDYCLIQDDILPKAFNLPLVNSSNTITSTIKSIIFMIYVSKISGSGNLKITTTNCTLSKYNSETYSNMTIIGNVATISDSGLYILQANVTGANASLEFAHVNTSDKFSGVITLGTCDVINGLNSDLGLVDFATQTGIATIETDLLDELRDVNFYYNYKADKTKLIELDSNTTPKFDMLSPYILYDFNNIANKFTLSEIDFSSSKIDVVRSSRL